MYRKWPWRPMSRPLSTKLFFAEQRWATFGHNRETNVDKNSKFAEGYLDVKLPHDSVLPFYTLQSLPAWWSDRHFSAEFLLVCSVLMLAHDRTAVGAVVYGNTVESGIIPVLLITWSSLLVPGRCTYSGFWRTRMPCWMKRFRGRKRSIW